MQAAKSSMTGKSTSVIDNNGIADLVYTGKNGHKYYQQVKIGYKPGQIDFGKYKGQTVVVDKGNPYFKEFVSEGKKHGVNVVEGNVTKTEAQSLATTMQRETSLTGSKTATIVPKVTAAHNAGLQAGKTGALYGGGFSLGSNIVDVVSGDKEIGEAAADVAKDTAVSYAAGYVIGATGSVVASTSAGAAVIGAASTAGSMLAGTAAGGAVVGAGTTVAAVVGGAGVATTSAVVGAVGAAGSAVGGVAVAATAGTAVGGAVATGVAATAAVGTAIGAATVAAAPIVAVGAFVGVGYKLFKKLWD